MCGIVGYVGPREAQEVLLTGLERLEYRGYDSIGVAIQGGAPTTRPPNFDDAIAVQRVLDAAYQQDLSR